MNQTVAINETSRNIALKCESYGIGIIESALNAIFHLIYSYSLLFSTTTAVIVMKLKTAALSDKAVNVRCFFFSSVLLIIELRWAVLFIVYNNKPFHSA